MHLTQITPPAAPAVSLAEAKAHLRYLVSDQDTVITALVATAEAHLAGRHGWTGRALVTQTWEMRLDMFPCGAARLELPLPPLQSVTSITYVDEAGATQTMPSADYVVEAGEMIGGVRLAYDKTWPIPRREPGAVRVRYVAGYGDAAAVPAPFKQAVLLLVGQWFVHKMTVAEAGVVPLPFAVDALVQPYRVAWL